VSDLAKEIVKAVKSTPDISREYMCHGEPHFSSSPDYEEMEKRIDTVLNVKPEEVES